MGCAGETDAPEQQDGLKQDVQGETKKGDQTTTTDDKAEQERLRSGGGPTRVSERR